MAIIYLGLGSNIGDRKAYLNAAINSLNKIGFAPLRISRFIETEPVGGPVQRPFLNAVIQGESGLEPEELLSQIKVIEKRLGRGETVRNGPRVIDIDILLYDSLEINLPHLIIPHPRMFEREFVMIPLKQIAPELVEDLLHANP